MTQPTRVWNRVRVICNIIKRRKMMRVWRRGRNMGKRGGRILETRSKRDRRMRNSKNRKCGRRIYTRKTRIFPSSNSVSFLDCSSPRSLLTSLFLCLKPCLPCVYPSTTFPIPIIYHPPIPFTPGL